MAVNLAIDPDTVRMLIEKARTFSADVDTDYEDGHEHDIEFDPAKNIDRHAHDGLQEEEVDDLRSQELTELIDDLNSDESADLVALAWIGRGDFEAGDWKTVRQQARERAESPTSRYLMGMPMLGDYLESGLSAIGR